MEFCHFALVGTLVCVYVHVCVCVRVCVCGHGKSVN